MPLPVVAIQIEVPAEPPYVEQLLEACNAGAGPGACVLADARTERAPYLAYVSWLDDAEHHALIEVGPRQDVRGSFEFRRLRFSQEDRPHERWEAIGLTVASLIAPMPTVESPAPTAVVSSEHAPPAEEPAKAFRAGVAARIGSGSEGAGPSAGLELSLAYECEALSLFPVAFCGWRTAAEGGYTGQWWEGGIGLGLERSLGPLRLGLAGLVVGQLFSVSASHGGADDSGKSSTPGLAAAVQCSWPRDGAVGATVGAQVLQLARATEISAAGTPALEAPRTNYGASLGLEGRF